MKEALKNGLVYDNKKGVTYFFHKLEQPIGYNGGELTSWMRIELTNAPIPSHHSHPVKFTDVKKYFPNLKE